jgi:hypothetical protein
MTEENWHQARLIPTSGINGAPEQERRATSALLAVLGIVPDFSKSLLSPLGAPSGKVSTYIEVPFDLDGQQIFPDGLIRVKRGTREWTALIEVKTGKNDLQSLQLENYLDVARAQGFDALITLSNEIPPAPDVHPTTVDRRKLRKVALHHWSWSYVLSTAIMQKEHRGVSDPEQAWILGELIRYLEHERSGAMDFDDMGQNWVAVREAVETGTLRQSDKGAPDVAARFDALLRYASLRLGRRLGTDVTPQLTRQESANPSLRTSNLTAVLAGEGALRGSIRIPDAVSPIYVEADLRAKQVTCVAEVDAPDSTRQLTRVNWILRQLKSARPDVRVEAVIARSRTAGNAELLSVLREDPSLLIQDPQREIRAFKIALSQPLGAKRGRGRGSFIDSVLDCLDLFYADVIEQIKPSSVATPKMRKIGDLEKVPAELISTDLSSQDGPSTDQ